MVKTPHPFSNGKKVLFLNCKHCQTLLTDRAMKAMLVARPSVHLYSTDWEPINCRTAFDEQDRLKISCTCELQHTACSCCGNIVGYFIVNPCSRCNSQNTNGHKWVFHLEDVEEASRLNGLGKSWQEEERRHRNSWVAS
ncbi:hypothetical protein K493DRAFT_210252 [Basidiobolus meristosporus CBS 931.73]|uniref:Protein FAM72 n=1 Tax=Basidiobolus meristosporus CBS 931.73 TaxID=1314790 RepID=A0A1Y1YSQ9_9FUNG|nr:hypothetical protein K493DRAFT_210252 [Basidiobolus meristosporus CBS 931.73]|eukprot:ORY01006.1 hypothetical protein K493DRAFT_210252 [Basidiobolus meristosporus CBS 931.73]